MTSAADEVHKKEDELKATLARVGPGLTPDQIKQVEDTFRAENRGVYDRERTAAENLLNTLKDPTIAADDAAVRSGYAELAKSPSHAEQALQWVSAYVEANPARAEDPAIQDIAGDALENAIPSVLGKAQSKEDALQNLKTYLAPLFKGAGAAKKLKPGWDAIQAAAKTPPDFEVLRNVAAQGFDSKLAKAGGIAALAFGAYSAQDALQQQQYARAIEGIAGAGKAGTDLLVGFAATANRARGLSAGPLEGFARVASRFGGALAVVGATAGFAQDLKALIDGKGGAYGVAVAGDLVTLAGGALVATGVAAPVGAFLIAVGTVVNAVGRLFGAQSEREKLAEKTAELLRKANIPEDLVDPLSKHFDAASALSEAGYTPEEIQGLIRNGGFKAYEDNVDQTLLLVQAGVKKEDLDRLVRNHGEQFQDKRNIEGLLAAGRALGLEGPELVDFADRLKASKEGWGPLLANINDLVLGRRPGTQPAKPETGAETLRRFVEGNFPEAYALARERAPEQFSPEAVTARKARLDVESAQSYGGTTTPLQLANLVDEHSDDPAYLDSLVRYIRDQQGESGVQSLRNQVESYEEDSLGAYDAAAQRTA